MYQLMLADVAMPGTVYVDGHRFNVIPIIVVILLVVIAVVILFIRKRKKAALLEDVEMTEKESTASAETDEA